MTGLTLGDLAQSLQLRQDNQRIRDNLQRLSSELSSGVKADVTAAVSGDFGALSSIEHGLTRLQSLTLAAQEAGLMATTGQQVLEQVQTNMAELSRALLLIQGAGQPALVDTAAADASVRMASVVSALNARVSDRTIFAGAATDGPALASSSTMLVALEDLVAGETTADGVAAIIKDWFAPGGGFDSQGYLGAIVPAASVPIAEGEMATRAITANDVEMRDTLAALAMAAILDRGALAPNAAERAVLARLSGEAMLEADSGLVKLRADIGTQEGQVDRALARNAAEIAALDLARSELISVDPFATATELKAAEAQLEALYTLTARLSRLSLTEYLR